MRQTVFCLFHNYSDWECTSETLVGIFFTQEDAETGLLLHIERAERLGGENQAFDARFRTTNEKLMSIKKKDSPEFSELLKEQKIIVEDQRTWRIENFGQEWSDIPDLAVENYSIEPLLIGSIRSDVLQTTV